MDRNILFDFRFYIIRIPMLLMAEETGSPFIRFTLLLDISIKRGGLSLISCLEWDFWLVLIPFHSQQPLVPQWHYRLACG